MSTGSFHFHMTRYTRYAGNYKLYLRLGVVLVVVKIYFPKKILVSIPQRW